MLKRRRQLPMSSGLPSRCNSLRNRRTPLDDHRIRTVGNTCSCTWNRPNRNHGWYEYRRALFSKKQSKSIDYVKYLEIKLKHTLVHGELNNLLDLAAKRVLHAFVLIGALDGQIHWRDILCASGIIVAVAFVAPDGRA